MEQRRVSGRRRGREEKKEDESDIGRGVRTEERRER